MKEVNQYILEKFKISKDTPTDKDLSKKIDIEDISEKMFILFKEIIDNGSKNPFKVGRCNSSSLKNLKTVLNNVYNKLNDEDYKLDLDEKWGYIAHFETAIDEF